MDLVLALPLALFMVACALQVGLWAHAQHRLQAIATQAAQAARAADATAGDGLARADQLQHNLGGNVLTRVEVELHRGADAVEVEATGQALSLIPGWAPQVHTTVHAPTETLPGGGSP